MFHGGRASRGPKPANPYPWERGTPVLTTHHTGGSMTKHRMLAMGLVSGLLAAPAVASAGGPGSLNFDNYCVTGAIQVCASVRLQSVAGHLTMQVWNLQGTLGSVNTITSIGLYHSNALYKFKIGRASCRERV